jgi:hypothetical protein
MALWAGGRWVIAPVGSTSGSGTGVPVSTISPSGSPVVDTAPKRATDLVGLRQPHEEALGAGGAAEEDEQQARRERIQRAGVADLRALRPPRSRRTPLTTSCDVRPGACR